MLVSASSHLSSSTLMWIIVETVNSTSRIRVQYDHQETKISC